MNAEIESFIESVGFDNWGTCSAADLQVRPEVRDMCANGNCQKYDTCWSCPPACGDIASFQARIDQHSACYLVQTVEELEDSFDFETMMEAAATQQKRVHRLNDLVKERYPDAMVLSSGTCDLCASCTYPDAPCRMPDKALVSMEAAGLVVSEICTTAGIAYNHGPNTICYTSCVLL